LSGKANGNQLFGEREGLWLVRYQRQGVRSVAAHFSEHRRASKQVIGQLEDTAADEELDLVRIIASKRATQAGESVNDVEKARPRSDRTIIRLVQRFTTLARGSANQRGDTFLES